MNILYILLDPKTAWTSDGLSHVKYVTYGPPRENDAKSVGWSAENLSPISHLIEQARRCEWKTLATAILRRHDEPEDSRIRWLESSPEQFARFNLEEFDQSGGAQTQDNQRDARIVRDLKHAAQQIVERRTAFVFPAEWSREIAKAATGLIKSMVKELCTYFREIPIEQELPWTFLSTKSDTDGQDTLGEFIRTLHSEMLADKSGVDAVAWRQKSGAILLSGPTGSGKSYAARLLAADAKYRSHLVEVNLAAVTEEQLESRMRGYKAGTFTGAAKEGRAGWFEEAHGGVLFLDEFQSVPLTSQVHLLDLLAAVSDDIQIARTGADHERRRFNVKVILAINEDIETLLREKRLRQDIYYRVRSIEKFPSLKERLGHDANRRYLRALLASYRWKSLRTIEQLDQLEGGWRDMVPTFFPVFSLDALSELANQEWEGNFRELERVAFDLFYECDYRQQSARIDGTRVTAIMQSWHPALPQNRQENVIDGMTEAEQKKLLEIQQVLRKSGFVISTALTNQAYFRSRSSLKKYLRSHIENLAPDVRSDSRMIRFLGLQKSSSD